ncbi:uncharacterized protein LOC120452512 [Drosophila santomea]|uniref:uncharacterized protein LOC120452512 n=1 Tax=Drosophila santomea TaxID=129105 RepID=UPI0019546162|nr:uncharacterized protein LOC120452512 [Drosophila santomea]XP_039492702.1 uncharacterized protein LOC120452512 [Drosophila santomea]
MRSGLMLRPMLVVLLVGHLVAPVVPANLLTSYLPASMQALAYYIDLLQYEPLSSTTVEPPFSADDEGVESTTASPRPSTPLPTRMKTSTTRRPIGGVVSGSGGMGWWQPPSWWETPHRTSTTERPTSPPTLPHRPAIFAPATPPEKSLEGNDLFAEIGDDEDFDDLSLSLIRDIQNERYDFTNDVESLDNFLRLYDDNYGRAAFGSESAMDRWSTASIAGKKRVPPTKPYVDFLLVYDLLKRDAKAASLSKYEGYSEDLLVELHALSQVSAARQLHTLFKRMLDRGDIQRSDVVARVQGIAKDLGNPKSATSKALTFIPSMQFLP